MGMLSSTWRSLVDRTGDSRASYSALRRKSTHVRQPAIGGKFKCFRGGDTIITLDIE